MLPSHCKHGVNYPGTGAAKLLSMNVPNASGERIQLWKRIGEDFRQACLLRREGKAEEATAILEKRLPETITAWARVCGLREPERRTRLSDLFEQEQKRVDDIWLSQQIILRQMRDILIPSLCLQVAEEVREVMELQMEHVTSALARLSPPPAPAIAPPAPVAASVRGTIVKLPQAMPSERSATPRFEDLPAIIDELISRDLRETALSARSRALV